VEALRRAAEAVGDANYPAAEAPGALDELTRIRAALDRAHARISESSARLAERLRSLQEHLTNVAHDLRTPLASLQAHVEEALDAEAHAESRESLQRALADCVYLAGLSENLRLASQLQEGWDPARAGELDLTSTVERVAGRLLHYARRRGISLQYAVPDAPIWVRCDAFACEQALGNVIENAVTHLSAGGRVGVVLDALAERRFALTVVDDGPGVAPSELSQLGERTFRSDDARARDPRGSGLGLAIAKTVCDRCGWTLEFSRAQEGGLRVEIRGQSSERTQ
jgi:signal transduction histidine kinase